MAGSAKLSTESERKTRRLALLPEWDFLYELQRDRTITLRVVLAREIHAEYLTCGDVSEDRS